MRRLILAVPVVLLATVFLAGCGRSKEAFEAHQQQEAGHIRVVRINDAAQMVVFVRKAPNGDKANEYLGNLEHQMKRGALEWTDIRATPDELKKAVEDKYFADSQESLEVLKNPSTGPEEAKAAAAKFRHCQPLSGRELVAYPITDRQIDALVAGANRQNQKPLVSNNQAPKRRSARN